MTNDDKPGIMKAGSLRTFRGAACRFGLLSALAFTISSAAASATAPSAPTATPTQAKTSRSACDVLTKQEVEAVLGAKIGEPVRRADACHFEPAGRPARGVIVTVYWTGGVTKMEATRMAAQISRNSGGTAYKELSHSNDDLKDLGDDATFLMKTLNVLKGDAYLKIEADQWSREQTIALARKALPRM